MVSKLKFQGSYTDKVKAAESVKDAKGDKVIRERKLNGKTYHFVFTKEQ